MFKSLSFRYMEYLNFTANFKISLKVNEDNIVKAKLTYLSRMDDEKTRVLSIEESKIVLDLIEECNLQTWHTEYRPEGFFVSDGFRFEISIQDYKDSEYLEPTHIGIEGMNAYPWCFYKLMKAFIIAYPELKEELSYLAKEKKPVY